MADAFGTACTMADDGTASNEIMLNGANFVIVEIPDAWVSADFSLYGRINPEGTLGQVYTYMPDSATSGKLYPVKIAAADVIKSAPLCFSVSYDLGLYSFQIVSSASQTGGPLTFEYRAYRV